MGCRRTRTRPGALALGGLLAAVGIAAPSMADAHRFAHPKTLRLGVRGDRLLLAITYDVNPGREASRTRGMFDRDSDGALDPAERELLLEALERTCWLWLETTDAGAAVPQKIAWTRRERTGHRLDRPAGDPSTLGLALLYEAPLPKTGEVTLTIADRDRDKSKHVPLTVDLGPTWRVALASQGEWRPTARQVGRIALGLERAVTLRLQRRSDARSAPPG